MVMHFDYQFLVCVFGNFTSLPHINVFVESSHLVLLDA